MKDEPFLDFLRKQPCWYSNYTTDECSSYEYSDPHHLGDGIHSRRLNDQFAIPLCRKHHDIAWKIEAKYGRSQLIEVSLKYMDWYLENYDEFDIMNKF